MAGTVKKLQFSEGTDVGAPTDLGIASSTTQLAVYVDDAAFVTANGAAQAGDCYINSTDNTIHKYVNGVWRSVATGSVLGYTSSFEPVVASSVSTVTNSDATMTTTDGYFEYRFSTGNTNRILNLPAASTVTGRKAYVIKSDSGTGLVTIDPNSSEVIGGESSLVLTSQYDSALIVSNGTSWDIVTQPQLAAYSAKTANYTVSDVDGVRTIGAAAPSTSFTVVAADVDTTDNEFDEVAHGLVDGDAIHIETNDTMPAGVFTYLTYYVVNASANAFSIALTPGGSEIDITSQGSGTHTVYKALKVTLPTAADNANRSIAVVKTDSNINRVVIDGEGAELVGGATHLVLCTQREMYDVQCTGSAWEIVGRRINGDWYDISLTFIGIGSPSASSLKARRVGDSIEIRINTTTGTTTATPAEIRWPSGIRIHTDKVGTANDRALGYGQRLASGGNVFLGTLAYVPFFDGRDYGCSMTFATGANTYTAQNGNGIFANNETQDMRLSFPVAGWES